MAEKKSFWAEIVVGSVVALIGVGGTVYTTQIQTSEARQTAIEARKTADTQAKAAHEEAVEARRAATCEIVLKAVIADSERPSQPAAEANSPAERDLETSIRAKAIQCLGVER